MLYSIKNKKQVQVHVYAYQVNLQSQSFQHLQDLGQWFVHQMQVVDLKINMGVLTIQGHLQPHFQPEAEKFMITFWIPHCRKCHLLERTIQQR